MNREEGVSKSAEKTKKSGNWLHRLKSQQILSWTSHTELFDFPTEIAGLPM